MMTIRKRRRLAQQMQQMLFVLPRWLHIDGSTCPPHAHLRLSWAKDMSPDARPFHLFVCLTGSGNLTTAGEPTGRLLRSP